MRMTLTTIMAMVMMTAGCAAVDHAAMTRRVMDTMGMHPSITTEIVVCASPAQVGLYYEVIYGVNRPLEGFYSRQVDTIFYVAGDRAVFAHEMAHAVIDAYFREPVPVWVHETLAQAIVSDIN